MDSRYQQDQISSKQTLTSPYNGKFQKNQKSWRTLTFFKNSGLMIRFEIQKQSIYFSFIKKTSERSYQKFSDGFVIKIDLFSLNELIYCLSLETPQEWLSWREKNNLKYQIQIQPFHLDSFYLVSKAKINSSGFALKFAVRQGKENIHQFILSPYEFWLVLDMAKDFRKSIIHQFSLSTPPPLINKSRGLERDE